MVESQDQPIHPDQDSAVKRLYIAERVAVRLHTLKRSAISRKCNGARKVKAARRGRRKPSPVRKREREGKRIATQAGQCILPPARTVTMAEPRKLGPKDPTADDLAPNSLKGLATRVVLPPALRSPNQRSQNIPSVVSSHRLNCTEISRSTSGFTSTFTPSPSPSTPSSLNPRLHSSSASSSPSFTSLSPSSSAPSAPVCPILKFLLACTPPLPHFHSHFLAFFSCNADLRAAQHSNANDTEPRTVDGTVFLYAMSAWSDEYRYNTLKYRILVEKSESNRVGMPKEIEQGEMVCCASEAEIAVLDFHLVQYGFTWQKEEDASK